jgi:flagellar motor switch protein FliM
MSDFQSKKNKNAHSFPFKTGIRALIKNNAFSYDNSADLKRSVDQFRLSLVNAFSKIVNEPLKCVLSDPILEEFTKAENSGLLKGSGDVFLSFSSKSPQISGCIGLDETLVFHLIELLLGNYSLGNSSMREKSFSEESPTLIEQVVIKKIGQIILNSLEEGLSLITSVRFTLGDIVQNFSITQASTSDLSVLCLPLMMVSDTCKGSLSVAITFNQKQFANRSSSHCLPGSDNSQNILDAIKDIVFPFEGTICDKNFKNLSELLNLSVGETLILEHNTDEDIFLRCENFTIAQGKVGESNKNVAIKITHVIL